MARWWSGRSIATAMQTFDAQFRRAGSMTVSFPSGNEPPWTIGLNGSTAISNAFGRCVTDLTPRTARAAARAGAAGSDAAVRPDAGAADHAGSDAAQPTPR